MTSPLRVCIVALNAYPAVNPASGGQVGGTETRAWLFARELAKRPDFEVSLAVRTTETVQNTVVDGVRLISQRDRFYRHRESVGGFASRKAGFPWIQIHRWSPSLLWQIPLLATARLFEDRPADPRLPMGFFQSIEADLFCCFGNQATAATAIASAQATKRLAILFLGSDDDLNSRYTADSQERNPYGDTGATCHYSLTQADAVFVQTPEQRMMLQDRFGRDGIVIPNPIDLEQWDSRASAALPDDLARLPPFVLWVGRAESIHKRPHLALEIARKSPEVPFLLLLNPRDAAVDADIRKRAPDNVHVVTQVPFPLMPALFRRALAYLNTSSLEGFPNAMLQAAASRVPIISLEVGAGFLRESQAGVHTCGNTSQAAAVLQEWQRDTHSRERYGSSGRAFVEQHHSVAAVSDQFAEALVRVGGVR